ncbi:DUF4376 domain-containing protein [Accumulibacter sp.]|nr:DUF4376 domain-containing protein [Accumulibacter sp.]MCM8595122.1 DUF4376 domain-containing protein [Accumulibacter sp.]MDS4049268.1 DUF4376 domain-containing protein [Accumulibacter sp.]
MQSGQLVACSPQDLLTLAEAKAQQIGVLAASYQSAILQPVTFTSQAGVAKSYQSDPQTVANLQAMIAAFTSAKATPTGFYWVAADNSQVPFSFADLLGLAAALGAQGWSAFQHLQTQKAAVLAASTVAAVLSVTW